MVISTDAVIGSDKQKAALWIRIQKSFEQHVNGAGTPKRNHIACLNRWSIMQQIITKFSGCMAQIERNYLSGQDNEYKMTAAKELFARQNNTKFKFDSCWNNLKSNNKWHLHTTTPSSVEGSAHISENDPMNIEECHRPEGQKAAKQRRNKDKR
ncbi:glutathione S-transferase T3-like [Cornus florida]|uniref:glutathione S-transferase T3-like n=1 Tax=Cornus florida TaxID=4283 RepID=UPI00289C6910|nr:glutathione S-transferase T3-like [Cornus florida]